VSRVSRISPVALLLLCACVTGSRGDDGPAPAASAIAQAPPGAIGADYQPPSWSPGYVAPPPPVPTTPPTLPPTGDLESPFDPPPPAFDAGPDAGTGTQL
jgi:hypothetical protein